MCCLSFEEAGYKKMAEKLPPLDSEVRVEGKRGRVVAHHILKQTVSVFFEAASGEPGGVVEVEVGKIKKVGWNEEEGECEGECDEVMSEEVF